MTAEYVDDRRYVLVDMDDYEVYGPYNERELRAAMLEDLCDPEVSKPLERIEYQAMTTEALLAEYQDMTGTRISRISEPTDEWRQEVNNG